MNKVIIKSQLNTSCMFYLEKREGFARIGRIEINGKTLETPCILDFSDEEMKNVLKSINFGYAPYIVKYLNERIYEALKPKEDRLEILTGLSVLNPYELIRIFKELKFNKPIYAVASATPLTIPILVYLGVDIFDNILAIAKAYQGIYFFEDFEIGINDLKSFPCSCEACKQLKSNKDLSYEEKSELIAKHNTEVLKRKVELCKILIEGENLRNYIESVAKLNPELTVVLRLSKELEDERFSRFKKSKCYFNTIESFERFEVRYFLSRAVECYKPKTKALLILPCTAKKPYLTSKTHRAIRSKVKINVNEIIVSSPLVVPREFELLYPAVNYDTPVTGHWTNEEIDFVAKWLRRFVEKGEFEKIVAHVEGGYRKVVERALQDYEVVFTAENGLTSDKSIDNLRRELECYTDRYDLYEEMFDHMFRYQFGIDLNVKGEIRGRYPELELVRKDRLMRVDIEYGMLDVYRDVAKKLIDKKVYTIKIADFKPKSKIFASGVVDASKGIQPNDIVVFYNDDVFGVGKAVMSSKEMIEFDRGLAVRVKRIWEF